MKQSGRRVAVVSGDGSDGDRCGGADAVRKAIRDAGGEIVDPADADAIVALGEKGVVEAALETSGTGTDTVAAGTDTVADEIDASRTPPVLPIGTGRYAAPNPTAADAVRQLLAGDAHTVEHPILAVDVDGRRLGQAVFDVTLVTEEPARISEYGVSFPSDHAASVRADALVVATPLGSDGYAGAADGPTLDPETGLSVVPVAPFTTGARNWVAANGVTLSVERDEEPVSIVVDDERRERVPTNQPIRVTIDDRVDLLSTPAVRARE